MRRWFVAIGLATAAVVVWTAAGQARVAFIPPPAPAVQLGQAELVVVGRVVGHEPKDIEVPVAPNAKETIKFRIAVIKVVDPILGAKDAKTLRVGYTPIEAEGGRPGRGRQPGAVPNLDVGMNALFFLIPHGNDKFHVPNGLHSVRVVSEETGDAAVKTFKHLAKLLDDPMASLQAKNAEERFQTATLLVHRYRNWRGPGEPKQVSIPAEESKLILKAMLEGNWDLQPGRFGQQQGPLSLFLQLGVSDKVGWKPKADQPVAKSAQEWVRQNAGTYRIKRFVAAPSAQKVAAPGARIDLIRD